MASARQLPPNKPAAGEPVHHAARWPVLARIAEIRRDDAEAPARPPVSSAPNYRLDAPHVDVPAPPPPMSAPAAKLESHPVPTSATTTRASSSKSVELRSGERHRATATIAPQKSPGRKPEDASAVPAPIRAAVDVWQGAQPRHELIRFAAMLALMVAAGMSAVLMMRDRFRGGTDASSPVAATIHQPGTAEPATQHAELGPVLEPQLTPETDTSSLEPTATGPLSPPSKPVMAVESKETPSALPYPTTSLAEVTIQPVDDKFKLPQVQTTEREVALQGTVIETKVR